MIAHEVAPYLAYWKQQQKQQKVRDREAADKARSLLPPLIDILVNQFQANKIILFGSLAKGKFTQTSDLDLAVAGIPHRDYFKAFADLNFLSEFEVDLKPLEELDSHFYERVMETGQVIYDVSVSH
ncbi:MAG: nucleotidyltransferase family protein [Halothece sp.]